MIGDILEEGIKFEFRNDEKSEKFCEKFKKNDVKIKFQRINSEKGLIEIQKNIENIGVIGYRDEKLVG